MTGIHIPGSDIRYWLKCPNCQWTAYRYRKRTGDYFCTHCGAIFIADYEMKRTKLIQPPAFNPPKVKGR